MAQKPATSPKPEGAPAAANPLPSSGGAWLRLTDGSLIRDPAEHPPEVSEDPVQPQLKDA